MLSPLIRTARTRAGLSQAELARLAGTSQPALARYETGAAIPTFPTLERLLLACGRRLEVRDLPGDDAAPVTSVRGRIGVQAEALRRNRRRLLDAARSRGISKVRVFGSVARGDSMPESDIDLLVHLEPGRTLIDLAAFRREAKEILGSPVDVATSDMLKERARAKALAEALPL